MKSKTVKIKTEKDMLCIECTTVHKYKL